MKSIKNVLVIGSGSAGQRHLRVLKNIRPELVVKLESARRNLEKIQYRSDLGTSAEEFKPDLVVIASPSTFHLESARHYIDSNIFIEKPLSANLNGVANFKDLVNKHGTSVTVGYNLRFSKSLLFFKDCVSSKMVGEIFSIRVETGQYLPNWRPGTRYENGVSANGFLGGGVILELSHEIDYLLWIFGSCEWVTASVQKLSKLNLDVEDSAFIILGILERFSNRRIVANLVLDFIRQDRTRTCIAVGEFGSLRWDGITQSVSIFRSSGNDWETIYQGNQNPDDTYALELESFIDSVERDKSPQVSLEEAIEVIKVADAIKSSSLEGKKISLETST
jgi:predicted dehydrogenase